MNRFLIIAAFEGNSWQVLIQDQQAHIQAQAVMSAKKLLLVNIEYQNMSAWEHSLLHRT